ncbi:type 1 glutamine amidotransferase [Methanolobus profundi]|uniref:GMP synthase-Glutamine amidotransferase n=1 Tax=Methanolobus profundi TaxID=487685 RepID=A0A1I4U2Y7_9EURY|nr:type 1 glutamine amidotransferase [Methanolobus profundi]SFM83378.1 GMP synthase-Glutamine amidotransferase [Methanolobus profundi]
MKIHCLVHLEFETLGNIKEWACNNGHSISVTMPYMNSNYPHPDEFDLLVIMGGLMSVYQEDEYPWLIEEKEFVKNVIESGKSVYGICFGAQMLSEILGGQVSQNMYREIGWHIIQTLDAFREDDSLFNMPPELTVFQWHGDTFTLPKGARRLFESEACPEQGFIYRDNVLAVQFHPETDESCVDSLVTECASDLVKGRYIQSEQEIRGRDDLLASSSDLMFTILDWFEENIKAKASNDA